MFWTRTDHNLSRSAGSGTDREGLRSPRDDSSHDARAETDEWSISWFDSTSLLRAHGEVRRKCWHHAHEMRGAMTTDHPEATCGAQAIVPARSAPASRETGKCGSERVTWKRIEPEIRSRSSISPTAVGGGASK